MAGSTVTINQKIILTGTNHKESRILDNGFPCQGKSFRPISIYEMVKSDLANRSGGYSLKVALMVVCH